MDIKRLKTFNIGGFSIRVNFYPSTLPYEQRLLENQILSHYRGFIFSPPLKDKAHATINLVDERHFTIIRRQEVNFSSFFEEKSNNTYRTFYHISLSQFTLIIAMILQKLLSKDGFILHASGVSIKGRAYLFTGPSEAGKSTVSRLLSARYPQLADDSIIVRKVEKQFFAFQSPLIEKNTHLYSSRSGRYPLAAIFLLEKTKKDPSFQMLPKDAATLKSISSQLWVQRTYASQMSLLLNLIRNVPVAKLAFPNDERVIEFAERFQHDFKSQPGGRLQPVQVPGDPTH